MKYICAGGTCESTHMGTPLNTRLVKPAWPSCTSTPCGCTGNAWPGTPEVELTPVFSAQYRLYTFWVVTIIVGWRPPSVHAPHICIIATSDSGGVMVETFDCQNVFVARLRPPYVAATDPLSMAPWRPSMDLLFDTTFDHTPEPRISASSVWACSNWNDRKLTTASGESVRIKVRPSTVTGTHACFQSNAAFFTVSDGEMSSMSKPW